MAADGFLLFLRYAEGCRCYLEEKGLIGKKDSQRIADSARSRRMPPLKLLRRVFYVAMPAIERAAKKKEKGIFDSGILREYYAFEHNRKKFSEGNFVCLAFPAKVLERRGRSFFIELMPVRGRLWVDSDLDAGKNDFVVFHRMVLTEKINPEFARRAAEYLKRLGMNENYKFPRVAIKYLRDLHRKGGSLHA